MSGASWQRMLTKAYAICDDIDEIGGHLDGMTLGGGTALMLHIDHRESRDIDFFLPSPQSLGFIISVISDREAWERGASYRSDGSFFVKVLYEDVGEIDFIAAPPVTDDEPVQMILQDRPLEVATVTEIIASKVHYRGDYLQPRDAFDIAAASVAGYRESILSVLETMVPRVAEALDHLEIMSQDWETIPMGGLEIRPHYQFLLKDGFAITRDLLKHVVAKQPRAHKPFTLEKAVESGNLTETRRLLKGGANVNQVNAKGWAPLHIAAYHASSEIVQNLLETGATVDLRGRYETTALFWAAKRDKPEDASPIILALLDAGADPTVPDNQNGHTALMVAEKNPALSGSDGLKRLRDVSRKPSSRPKPRDSGSSLDL